jgi:hypothetical protein
MNRFGAASCHSPPEICCSVVRWRRRMPPFALGGQQADDDCAKSVVATAADQLK